MESSNIFFRIDRCTNSTKSDYDEPCASPEQIDNYFYDLEVQTWAVHQQMDYSNYKEYPPIHYDNHIKSMILLRSDVATELQMQLRKHTIKTSDTIFGAGEIKYTHEFY